jgi:RNA polymerase sigma-70 factor (ECF subfamily)
MSNLQAIVDAHSDAVWRTVYRLVNHYDDARDCYQETFLAAVRLAGSGPVRNWRTTLVAIATRRAIDRLRARYRDRAALAAHALDWDQPSVEPPSADAERGELRELVRRTLTTLPPQQAEAFWLRHLEQLNVDEVAAQLAIEPGHVRVLVHRAAVAIRAILGPEYGPVPLSEEQT